MGHFLVKPLTLLFSFIKVQFLLLIIINKNRYCHSFKNKYFKAMMTPETFHVKNVVFCGQLCDIVG